MRTFRRYSTDIPINILGKDVALESSRPLYNVSYGGLACHSKVAFKSGEFVSVSISHVEPSFEATGVVVWCDLKDGEYELGIQFNEGREAFAARMVAQVCQIEKYKCHVLETEGRDLSGDEAALEWIEKNAHQQAVHERAYIRHPVDIPIEISHAQQPVSFSSKLHDFSLEGARFESASEIKPGEYVQIQLPSIEGQQEKAVEGTVMWCCQKKSQYEIGVKFREDEAFYTAMLKQIEQIESFKEEVERRDGRVLTGKEAVAEFSAYLAKSNLKDVGC